MSTTRSRERVVVLPIKAVRVRTAFSSFSSRAVEGMRANAHHFAGVYLASGASNPGLSRPTLGNLACRFLKVLAMSAVKPVDWSGESAAECLSSVPRAARIVVPPPAFAACLSWASCVWRAGFVTGFHVRQIHPVLLGRPQAMHGLV